MNHLPKSSSPEADASRVAEWTGFAANLAKESVFSVTAAASEAAWATLRAARNLAVQTKEVGESKVSRIREGVEHQVNFVAKLFFDLIGPAALEVLRSDVATQITARTIYSSVPLPVKVILGEERFVQFCVANKNGLLDRIGVLHRPETPPPIPPIPSSSTVSGSEREV